MPTPASPPPPRSPFLTEPPRPQAPPSSPALQQRAGAALALAVLSLLAMTAISNLQRAVYVLAVALAFTVIALVLAITAMSAARRSGTRRPRGAAFATALGAIGLVVSGFALAGFLLFSTQFNQYSSCMNAAGSATAQQAACQTRLNNAVGRELGILGGR